VTAWIEGCRLNIASGVLGHAGEPEVGDAFGKYLAHSEPAIENLAALGAGDGSGP
jgi:hypothetical protein